MEPRRWVFESAVTDPYPVLLLPQPAMLGYPNYCCCTDDKSYLLRSRCCVSYPDTTGGR